MTDAASPRDDELSVEPYEFPDPRRRRVPGWIYLALTAVVASVVDPVAALLPLALSVWHFVSAWPLRMQPEAALDSAERAVPFRLGHASAAVTFHGLRARPRWSVVLYPAADPPDQRALVAVDAVDGAIVGEPYVEDVPAV